MLKSLCAKIALKIIPNFFFLSGHQRSLLLHVGHVECHLNGN